MRSYFSAPELRLEFRKTFLAIASHPIFAADIIALSTAASPVSVETKKSTKLERPLAHGWIESATIEPGFDVFATRYDSYDAYSIVKGIELGYHFALNLGDELSADYPRRVAYLPSGNFNTASFDEPVPIKVHRGERRRQIRCGFWLRPEWINSGMFERFDDTGIVGNALSQYGISEAAVASPALLSLADRLYAAFNFDGPLAGLRREAAGLAFFAEAFTNLDNIRRPRPASRIEIGRIERVKEMLDSLPVGADVKLVELAAHHGMSVRSLCRHFRQTFGTTILGYVAERRMENARIALAAGGLTIDQAAYIAGFAHASNFSSAFRRRYGYSPVNGRRR